MITFESVDFTYPDAAVPTLVEVELDIAEGSLALVVGPTGAGKSTLLGAINGLVPRFTGGTLRGEVTVGGRSTRAHRLKDLADLVGMVGQNPRSGFATETVEDELAYTMEQLGIPPSVMRKRIEETLDLLGLSHLRHRPLGTVSGGEAQRVAIGSVLTAHPRVLVLDEPTSALDPGASEEVLAALTRLVHDLGMTVVVAEHRLERVVQYADQVIHISPGGRVDSGPPAAMMELSRVAPPIVELGRLAGWSPLPLSIRDARPLARRLHLTAPAMTPPAGAGPVLTATGVSVSYGGTEALAPLDLSLASGTITALMGRNGAGKSTLLWALQGGSPRRGTVLVDGQDPSDLDPAPARHLVALVPQTPADLLYLESVADECVQADQESGADPGTCWSFLDELAGPLDPSAHPADLSEGQRLGLVLAIQLTGRPRVALLDEPTRGLDYQAKERLGRCLRRLASEGRAVMIATHDVEFVAQAADRVVVLADGEVVADGPTAEVVVASPALAPQISRIFAPDRWLTVGQVATALEKEAV